MCLFTELADKCSHAECRIVHTIHHLNIHNIIPVHSRSQAKLSSQRTLPQSEKALPRLQEIIQKNQNQLNPVLEKSLSLNIVSEGLVESILGQNPQNGEQEIKRLRKEVVLLNRKVSFIRMALESRGIEIIF